MGRHMCEGPASPLEFLAKFDKAVLVKFLGADLELFKNDVVYGDGEDLPWVRSTHFTLADASYRRKLPAITEPDYTGERCTIIAETDRDSLKYTLEHQEVSAMTPQGIVDGMPLVLVNKVIATECVYKLLLKETYDSPILLAINRKLSSLMVHSFNDDTMALWTRSANFVVLVNYVPLEEHFRSMLTETDGLIHVDREKSWQWVKATKIFSEEETAAFEKILKGDNQWK